MSGTREHLPEKEGVDEFPGLPRAFPAPEQSRSLRRRLRWRGNSQRWGQVLGTGRLASRIPIGPGLECGLSAEATADGPFRREIERLHLADRRSCHARRSLSAFFYCVARAGTRFLEGTWGADEPHQGQKPRQTRREPLEQRRRGCARKAGLPDRWGQVLGRSHVACCLSRQRQGAVAARTASYGTYSRIRPRSRKPTAAYMRSANFVDCRLAV